MATLAYYLKKRKGKDEHPLYLRVTHNRKSKYIHTQIKLASSDWNREKEKVRKSNPLYKKLNNHLVRKKLRAKVVLLDLRAENTGFDVNHIVEAIESNTIENEDQQNGEEDITPDFFEYAEDVIQDCKTTRSHNRWKSFKTVLKKVREFWSKEKLPFCEITPEFLRKYEVHCMEVRGNKPNTVKSNLKKVRKIFNDAIREGVISRNLYPFDYYTMPSNPVFKPKLTEEEIAALESVATKKGTRLYDAQNIFIYAYYCWGMRFSDVCSLKWSNIKGDRMFYIMRKTDKSMSVKLPSQAKVILNYYKPAGKLEKEHYIFPFLDHRKDYSDKEYYSKQISSKNSLVNKYLYKLQKASEIDQHISFHIARHSFAQRCLEKDLRLMEIRDLLGHESITTTIKYLKSLGSQHLDKTVEGLFN